MLVLKNTLSKLKESLVGEKAFNDLHQSWLLQIIFLSTIKNYVYGPEPSSNLFEIPEKIHITARKNKKILVLDMDETLVHTRNQHKPAHNNYSAVSFADEDMYIEYRPHLPSFLEAAAEIFTVYVYTAGKKEYADTVLDHIDKKKIIERRFYRNSCKKWNGKLIKDLKHLKRSCKIQRDMILVDDNVDSVGQNYPCAVKVDAFQGNQNDRELVNIFKKLLMFYS